MMEEHFKCVSDGEEETTDHILSPLTNNEGSNENGTICKNLMEDFGSVKRSVCDEEHPGREHMKVYLRVRPFMEKELLANQDQGCIEIENDKAVVMHAPRDSFAFKNSSRGVGETCHRFTFSRVFDPQTSQKYFFDSTTLEMIKDFVDGQNCLVFTYGVTNSGKTYTIQGTAKDGGILPRSLDVLFNSINGKHYKRTNLKPKYFCDVMRLDNKQEHNEELIKKAYLQSLEKGVNNMVDDKNVDSDACRVADETTFSVDSQGPVNFSVWVSFAEIYNELIFDLLEPYPTDKGKKRNNLRIGDDKNGNPYIKGLREVCVNTADEAYKILKVGQKNQSISATKLNQCSSRSHSIFSVKVLRVVNIENPHVARVSRLSFVDLAGSERYTKTQSKGDRLKEAGNINTSLMTLGKCLDYLRYKQNNPSHSLIIPFRESKLTRLFQGTFCGRGKACMIVNVNQCASTYDETCHAMKFSAIAKEVTTKITKPVDLAPPIKKLRGSSILGTPSTVGRMSVPWANGALHTPAPKKFAAVTEADEDGGSDEEVDDGDQDHYQQQLIALVKTLQEKLIAERKSKMQLEIKIREEVCNEMAEQLVAIENSYSERMHDEVLAVEERCDRRIELLTKSMKKNRKRARVERFEDDEDEWVSSVLLHAEKTRVEEKDRLIQEQNATIARLRQELKQEKEDNAKNSDDSKTVIELQAKLNEANVQISELQQTLDDAGEAFAEKEAEILKLKKAFEADEKLRKEQDQAVTELRENLSSSVLKIKKLESRLAEKCELLVKRQEEIKLLEDSLEEAVLEDSQRATSLKKTIEDKEIEMKEVRELLVAKDEKIQKLELNIRKHSVALSDHETFVEALNGQVKQLTQELQETKSTAQTAENGSPSFPLSENTMKELENKNEIMKGLVKSLEETRDRLEKEKDNFSKRLQKEKNEKKEIQKKQAELEQQFSQLLKQLHSKEEALIMLQESELKARIEAKETINRENQLISERGDLKKCLNAAEIKIRELEEVMSRSKDPLPANARGAKSETENEKRLMLEITSLQGNLLETKNKNEELLKSQKDLSDRLEDAKMENTNLKLNESKPLAENEKLEEALRRIKNEVKVLEENAKRNEAKLVILKKENSDFKNIEKKLKKEIVKLEELLHTATAEKTELEVTVKAKNEMLGKLEKEKERLSKEKETRMNREKKLEKDKQRIGELMLAAENRCKELEQNLREKDKLLKDQEKASTEAKKEEKSHSVESESIFSSLQKQLEEVTIALDKKNTQLIARNNNVKRLELTLEDTKTELERLKLEAESYECKESPKVGNVKIEEMQALIDKQRENIKRLEENTALFENQKLEMIKLEEKFGGQNEEVKTLQEKVSKFEKLNDDFEELKKKAATLEKQREVLQKELDEQTADLEVARAQLTDTNKMLNSRNVEVEALESKLGQTRDYERSMDVLRSELLLARDCGRLKEAELDKVKEENTQLRKMKKSMTEENAKQDRTLACLKEVVQENEKILDEQEKALEIRQNEMEILTAALNAEREKADTLAKEIEKRDTKLGKLKEEIDFLTEENTKFEKEQSLEVNELKKEKVGLVGEIEVQRCTIEQLRGEQNTSNKWSTKEKDLLESEIDEKDEKIQQLREQMKKLEEEKENLEDVLDEKERSLKKNEEQKEKTMKAMREALEIAKAKKIEYETNLQETKEICEREITEKYEKVTGREPSLEFHRKLEEIEEAVNEMLDQRGRFTQEVQLPLDILLQAEVEFEIASKCKQFEEELTSRQATIERLEKQVEELAGRSKEQEKENIPDKSMTPQTSPSGKSLKRKSSDLTLAEVKRQLVKKQKTSQNSEDEFTPGSTRRSVRRSRRTRSQQPKSPSRLALSPIKGNELGSVKKVRFMGKFGELMENSGNTGSYLNEQPSVTNTAKKLMHSKPHTPKHQESTPAAKPSTTKKGRRKLLQLAASEQFAASPNMKMESVTPRRINNKDLITRTLRSRTVKSTK